MDVEAMNNYEDSSAPVVMTNTWIDISKNGMEKTSYISDTCGNFSKSTYDMVIHSSPFSIFGASSSGVTADSCLPYQVFIQDSNGGRFGSCENACAGNKYFDITTKTCQYCPIGYINDGNNQCIPLETCPRGFKYTDHSGNCNTCPSVNNVKTKKFDDGINCIDICLEPYKELGADGNCKLKCPSRNQYWDANVNNGSGGCIPCAVGMVNNGRNQCIALPPCPEGMYLNSDSKCVSKCESYERYNSITNQCQKICSPTQKFDKITGMCVECPTGFQSNIDDAYSCKAIPVPSVTCGLGYELKGSGKDSLCKSICPDDKKNSPMDPANCVPKCRPDQTYNTNNTDCVDCPYGNSVNNVCPSPPATTTPSPTSGTETQTICPEWSYHSKSPNSSKCSPYCDENHTYINGNCKLCGMGYHVNDKNQCQKNCPAWKINSTNNNDDCVNRCLTTTDYWDTTSSSCLPCGSDYQGVDSNNTCVLKNMDFSVNSINWISGTTGLLNKITDFLGLQSAPIYTSFKVSITFKFNDGPSFDHIDIRINNNNLIGNNSVNTSEKKLNGGFITTDKLILTTGINYTFTLKFYDSDNNEIRNPVTKYIKIQPDRHNYITSSTTYPLKDYSFYYEGVLFGRSAYVDDNLLNINGILSGKKNTGLEVKSSIGTNGSNTTLTIPSTVLTSSSINNIVSTTNGIMSTPGVAGSNGAIFYIIFYAEIGSNLDTRLQVVKNNGIVSCKTYCAGTNGHSWNNELPSSWPGATCIASGINNTDSCDIVGVDESDYDKTRRTCLCDKSTNPWVNTTVVNPPDTGGTGTGTGTGDTTDVSTVVIPLVTGIWNFSFNLSPSYTSANFANKVIKDNSGVVTITPPVGGWKVTVKNQILPGGFSNQSSDPTCKDATCQDKSNLAHVDKAAVGVGYYTPRKNILIPVNVSENKNYVAYMIMNTNGTLNGLFLPEKDIAKKNPSGFSKINSTYETLKNASRSYILDTEIDNNTLWYFSTGGTGTTYIITPFSGNKIRYNIDGTTIMNSGTAMCTDGYQYSFKTNKCYNTTCSPGYMFDNSFFTCKKQNKNLETKVPKADCSAYDGYKSNGTDCVRPNDVHDAIRDDPCSDFAEPITRGADSCTGYKRDGDKWEAGWGDQCGYENDPMGYCYKCGNNQHMVVLGTDSNGKRYGDCYEKKDNIDRQRGCDEDRQTPKYCKESKKVPVYTLVTRNYDRHCSEDDLKNNFHYDDVLRKCVKNYNNRRLEWSCQDDKFKYINGSCYNCPDGYKFNNDNAPAGCVVNNDRGEKYDQDDTKPTFYA